MKKMNFTKKGLALLLGSTILVGSLSGCNENNNNTESSDEESIVTIQEGQKEIFAAGEHILYIRVDASGKRLEYHPGYEIAGISSQKAYTRVLYVNNVEVECTASRSSYNGHDPVYDYITFGTPIELEKQKSEENSSQYSK